MHFSASKSTYYRTFPSLHCKYTKKNTASIQKGVKTQKLPHKAKGRIAKRFSGDRPFPCAFEFRFLLRCFVCGGCLKGEA